MGEGRGEIDLTCLKIVPCMVRSEGLGARLCTMGGGGVLQVVEPQVDKMSNAGKQ